MKYLFHAIAAVALLAATSVPAAATLVTYQYVGNNFTDFTGDSGFTSSDYMTITVQMDGPVTDGTVYATDWLSWSMSAGALSVGSAGGDTMLSLESFWGGSGPPAYITFNGGSIEYWSILGLDLADPGPTALISLQVDGLAMGDAVQLFSWGGGTVWSVGTPVTGTWSLLPDDGGETAVPEPGTLGLVAGGVLLLFLRRPRRAASQGVPARLTHANSRDR